MFKLFEFNSIRIRMVSGFLFLTFLILLLSLVSLSIIDRTTQIARVHGNISQLEIYTLSLIKSDNDFFNVETTNDSYFKTRKSDFLYRHDSLNHLISSEIKGLLDDDTSEDYGVRKSLSVIDSTLSLYHLRFKKLEELVYRKGFKDYGVEGAMRFYAHALEKEIEKKEIINILYLRRHEKDFLLRNDTAYLNAFRTGSARLLTKMKQVPIPDERITYYLQEYQRLFYELVSIQRELGLTSKNGLRNELNNLTYLLSNQYYLLSGYSYVHAETAYYNLRIFYITLLVGAIVFSLLSGYWISKRLSEPIASLSKVIQNAIKSGSATKTDFHIRGAAIEIMTLGNAFILLMNQVKVQLSRVKAKSNLLKEKNSELKKLNRELDNFFYSTAHDLRSPLSSLLGLINLVRYENKQPIVAEYIDMMEKSIQRSENFISHIVSFSKNKRTEIHSEKLDMLKIIENILADHQFIDGSTHIRKIVTVNESIPFYSDRSRITIVFNNLISNAIKYADFGKIEPFLKIVVQITEDEALIEFIDNGQGIDKVHIKNIFDMFYRAHTDSKGSGLGLFIFKETINRLNGHATIESVVGSGTKFYIRLPNLFRQTQLQEGLDFSSQSQV